MVDIYLSAGSGGVHVQVRKDQAQRALKVLARFDEIEKEIYESKQGKPESSASESMDKRKSLNKRASPLFFWFFALIAFMIVVMVVFESG